MSEQKYLLARSDVVFVHSMIVAGLDYRGYLEANEYHERTCTMLHGTAAGLDCYKCDECDEVSYVAHAPNYCPNCGCKVVPE